MAHQSPKPAASEDGAIVGLAAYQRRAARRISLRTLVSNDLGPSHSIISDGEALRILGNDLRRLALERRAAELQSAAPERKAEIMAEIDRDIQSELRKRALQARPYTLQH